MPSPLPFPNQYELCEVNPVDTLDHQSSQDLREIHQEKVHWHAISLCTLNPSGVSTMKLSGMHGARPQSKIDCTAAAV